MKHIQLKQLPWFYDIGCIKRTLHTKNFIRKSMQDYYFSKEQQGMKVNFVLKHIM